MIFSQVDLHVGKGALCCQVVGRLWKEQGRTGEINYSDSQSGIANIRPIILLCSENHTWCNLFHQWSMPNLSAYNLWTWQETWWNLSQRGLTLSAVTGQPTAFQRRGPMKRKCGEWSLYWCTMSSSRRDPFCWSGPIERGYVFYLAFHWLCVRGNGPPMLRCWGVIYIKRSCVGIITQAVYLCVWVCLTL